MSVVLALLAAAALAPAPILALVRGTPELLGFALVAGALLAAWRLDRGAPFGRWLVTVLAVLTAWVALRAWRLPLGFRILVPDYGLWRAGRLLGALLLLGAAAAAWSDRDAAERGPS
jgi:hypothetical protein